MAEAALKPALIAHYIEHWGAARPDEDVCISELKSEHGFVGSGRMVKGKPEGETGMCEYITFWATRFSAPFRSLTEKHPARSCRRTRLQAGRVSTAASLASGSALDTHCGPPWEGQIMTVLVYKGSYKLP